MNEKIFNVIEYGALADGETLCTAALQKAIDECHAAGGGTIVFPEGVYVLSTVFMKSNVRIHITKNALILGAPSFYDYAPQEKIDYPLYQDASHSYFDCSMFVAKGCENIAIYGEGAIDMRSVWDEDNVRDIVHRGPKCIALKECVNVEISGLKIDNVTDLAVYFAGCENVDVHHLTMRVYIDGVSPDNSKNVRIHDCDIEAGDDAIVFKTSYTLNRLGVCDNIRVWDCRLKSRCTAIKFGTETNGGFYNIDINNIDIRETRITGIAIESVDGAIADGITIKNVRMKNVGAPLFIHVGKRMRGPEGREIGQIRNVTLENIVAEGPYKPYEIIAWNYNSYVAGDTLQKPWAMGIFEYGDAKVFDENGAWQITSNVCGLEGKPLQNITLRNISLQLDGGVQEFNPNVPEDPKPYPEVNTYGRFLPARGIFFRHVDGLVLDNVKVTFNKPDVREDFVFDRVENLQIL